MATDGDRVSLHGQPSRVLQQPEMQDSVMAVFFLIPECAEISKIEDLALLASCPKLRSLDLRGNPVTQMANFLSDIAKLLPSVTDLQL